MKQFDLFINSGRGKKTYPYVVNLQSALVSQHLATAVVAPLMSASMLRSPVFKLHVPVEVRGQKFYVLVEELASVACMELAAPVINLEKEYGDELKTAIDVLFFNYP